SVAHQDMKSADDYLNQERLLKQNLRGVEKSEWARSGGEAELLDLAVKVNDSKLASESVMELLTSKDLEKADSLRLPQRWWATALVNFKKTGEQNAFKEVLAFVQDGYKQLLSRSSADQSVLADVVNVMDNVGEDKLATQLRTEAMRKFEEP